MAKSIMQTEKECFVCGTTYGLELHHCIYGTANRKLSDKYGLTIWLCNAHHTQNGSGIHFNKDLDAHVKKLAQERFEAVHEPNTRFIDVFGRNYNSISRRSYEND